MLFYFVVLSVKQTKFAARSRVPDPTHLCHAQLQVIDIAQERPVTRVELRDQLLRSRKHVDVTREQLHTATVTCRPQLHSR